MVNIQSRDGELFAIENTEQLWRIRLYHENCSAFFKVIDDYDRVWLSDDCFLVMPTKTMVDTFNRLLLLYHDWIHEEDGAWTGMSIEEFPFGPNNMVHIWSIFDNQLLHPDTVV